MNFKIKRKEFTPDVVGMYFTAQGDNIYKIVYVEDGFVRFAYFDDKICKTIVISGVRFSIEEFYKNLNKGSLVQIDWSDSRISDSLLSYQVKKSKHVKV